MVIVVKQLFDTMPASVCVWVYEHMPQDSVEAGQLVDEYTQARKVSGSGQPTSKRGERLRSRKGFVAASRWAT